MYGFVSPPRTLVIIRYEDQVIAMYSTRSFTKIIYRLNFPIRSFLIASHFLKLLLSRIYLIYFSLLHSLHLAADETGHFYTASSTWSFQLIYFDTATSKWLVRMLECKIITIYFQKLKAITILTKLYQNINPTQLLGTLTLLISVLFELFMSLCNLY